MGRKRGGGGDGGGGDGGESPLAAPHCPPSPTTLLDSSPLYPSIHIPESWSDAANSVALATASPPVVFICGPKNSGKTTFSRYLVNTLLPRYKNVAYLDTDVGQPEFTPPGCLSLHVLQEHTTDLKVMSLKTPVKCVFFGDISSKRDPKIYLDGIFSLYDYFLKEYCQASDIANIRIPILPLVINTAGWVKGAGYEQLVEMLRCITTTHVVQIRTSSQSKNLPRGFFWLDRNQDVATNLIEIYAARKDSLDRTVLTQKPSRDLRDIRIIAYFHQCVPHDMDVSTYKDLAYVLASIPPYEVPISTIKVQHLHCQIPSSEIFHSLNATIVGLAVSAEVTESGTPWCVGLGIVRGIDISNDLLYVITPVPPRILEKVDLFLQGFVEIPTSLLQIRGCMSPYMSANVLNKLDPSIMGNVDNMLSGII